MPSDALFRTVVPVIWTDERRLMIKPAPLFAWICASRMSIDVPTPANTPPVPTGLPFSLT